MLDIPDRRGCRGAGHCASERLEGAPCGILAEGFTEDETGPVDGRRPRSGSWSGHPVVRTSRTPRRLGYDHGAGQMSPVDGGTEADDPTPLSTKIILAHLEARDQGWWADGAADRIPSLVFHPKPGQRTTFPRRRDGPNPRTIRPDGDTKSTRDAASGIQLIDDLVLSVIRRAGFTRPRTGQTQREAQPRGRNLTSAVSTTTSGGLRLCPARTRCTLRKTILRPAARRVAPKSTSR